VNYESSDVVVADEIDQVVAIYSIHQRTVSECCAKSFDIISPKGFVGHGSGCVKSAQSYLCTLRTCRMRLILNDQILNLGMFPQHNLAYSP
jgi:hypothetical protein